MDIINPKIESYIASLAKADDPILTEMEERAARQDFPIVGPQAGRLLEMLARFAQAKRVLELGSGFGYSAYWFARGLAPGGVIHCTDLSAANRDLAMSFFRKAGLSERLIFHVGDALASARKLKAPFDIVFNDIDKKAYPESVETALALLRTGGLFITDNVLWKGRVVEGSNRDETAAAIVKFNEMVCGRRDLQTVILPLRDGLAVCQKK